MILMGLLYLFNRKKMENRTECLINTMLFWHIYLLVIIYVTSILKILNSYSILICELFIASVILFINRKIFLPSIKDCVTKKRVSSICRYGVVSLRKYCNLMLSILPLLFFLIVVLISYKMVEYNWDSMTYHLPRVAHWAQNQSVLPYATHIDRQIGSTTLTSYVCTYIYILSGKSDIFLNWVQCAAYGINAYMVYEIAKKCEIQKKFCSIAALLFITLPIAFAEALTTQNDLYATMWLLFFVYIVLDFNKREIILTLDRQTITKVAELAICMVMGYLAKPSVCFAMVIALFWTLYNVIRRKDKVFVIAVMLCVGGLVCLILVLPSWIQNYMIWGKISPDNVGMRQLIGTADIRCVFVNFLKNSTYNLGNSVIPNFKEMLSVFLYTVAGMLGVQLDAEVISESGSSYGFSSYPYGCDTALNPLTLVLFIIAVIILFITWKKQSFTCREYSVFALLSYVFFCSFLRWERFISRYMIGYFALMCPAIVMQLQIVVNHFKSVWTKYIIYGFILLLCVCNYGLDLNNCRINWPETSFYHVGGLESEYEDICECIIDKQYNKIGLITGCDSYEYPLWTLLKQSHKLEEIEIQHILVGGELNAYEDKYFVPDCIFVIDSPTEDLIEYHGSTYRRVSNKNENQVWLYERVSM